MRRGRTFDIAASGKATMEGHLREVAAMAPGPLSRHDLDELYGATVRR